MEVRECDMDPCFATTSNVAPLVWNSSSEDEDPLWAIIDRAERCLVSARNEESAELASSALRSLCGTSSSQVGGQPPVAERQRHPEFPFMIEAAGMVLLQALNEMGSSGKIFDELLSIFVSVSEVPYSLILTGICLQLPSGLHTASQTALEEYLSLWKPRERIEDGHLVQVGNVDPDCYIEYRAIKESSVVREDLHSSMTRKEYLQLTEIYVFEILAKLHADLRGAGLWIKNSCILEDDKQAMLAKLEHVSHSQRTIVSCNSVSRDHPCVASCTSVCESLQGTRDETFDQESFKHGTETMTGAPQAGSFNVSPKASEKLNRRAVVKGSGIFQRFPFAQTVWRLMQLMMSRIALSSSTKWNSMRYKLPEHRVLLAGAFASSVVYAMLWNRQFFKSLFKEVLKAVRIHLGDLWQLAFTVHLNPLAAVEPLSSSRT